MLLVLIYISFMLIVYGDDYVPSHPSIRSLTSTTSSASSQSHLRNTYDPRSSHMEVEYTVHTTDDTLPTDSYRKYYNYGPAGCADSQAATMYVMRPEVQEALHVKPIYFCW